MNARKLLALAVAVTVLVGGVAAVGAVTPGNAPTDEANGNAPDDASDADADDESDANETDANETHGGGANASAANASEAGPAANAPEHAENAAAAEAGERGPPSELPDPVPEHVSSIHEQIQSFLGGDVDHLGGALSGLLGDDGETTEGAAENETTTNESESASSVGPVA